MFVFAQEMEADRPGSSVGCTIPEALVDAGAHGIMLNHDSNPVPPGALPAMISRAQENGLLTMACAVIGEAARVAPNVLMMHAGGVATVADAERIMRAGAHGTGATSGVVLSEDPRRAAEHFIAATRVGFDASDPLA